MGSHAVSATSDIIRADFAEEGRREPALLQCRRYGRYFMFKIRDWLFNDGGMLAAFGERDFKLFWPGSLISNAGTWVQTTALLWYVKSTTTSNAWVGAVNLAAFLPILLFILLAGYFADRFNRRKLIIFNQTVLMVFAFVLAVATHLKASLPFIMTIVFIQGTAFAFNFPAWQTIVSDIVPPENLLNGLALTSASFNLGQFLGPAIGALILSAWTASGAFLVNGISFLFVIAALLMLRVKTPRCDLGAGGAVPHIKEGFAYVRRNAWARNILMALGVVSFFGLPYLVLMPTVAKDVLKMGTGAYGVLLSASGLGAVLCAPLVTGLGRRFPANQIIKVAVAAIAGLLLALSFSRTLWISSLVAFGLGGSFLTLTATINTVLQSRTDREMRGRVMSYYVLMLLGTFSLGGQLMGIIAEHPDAPAALLVGGIACGSLALVLFLAPGLTRDAVELRAGGLELPGVEPREVTAD